jgi:tetratricopeptide (TPR) repeat protein
LLFVVLGGALAGLGLIEYGPQLWPEAAAPVAEVELPVEDSAAALAEEDAAGPDDPEAQPGEPALAGDEAPPATNQAPPMPALEHKPDAISLALMAEAALESEQWREPAEGSLAMALTKLALVDPGHESILRLRREAETTLVPRGDKALKKKQWKDAADAYRDLIAVWPDHAEARASLIQALRGQGSVLRKHRDHEAVLAVADELLNLQPENYYALKLRADSLASLKRWEEAVSAFRAAMREKPRSKDARKSYWNARKMAAKAAKRKD